MARKENATAAPLLNEAARSGTPAPPVGAREVDRADDPLRLARKAETVLRARIGERLLLVLENCSDDLNHVAVLRTCEALGVMRVWLVEEPGRRLQNAYVQPGRAGSGGAAPAAAEPLAPPSRAQRRLEARVAQRGFEYDRMLGLRSAQRYASHLDVRTFASTAECIAAVRTSGRALWVTDLAQQALPLDADAAALGAVLPARVAVVLGSEGLGVSREMIAAAERRVYLPMWGFTESFNLAVAAALVLQRLLDAMPGARGDLPAAETARLRREWYANLARSDAARAEFLRLADEGGAPPFDDVRRPEEHRQEWSRR